MEVELNLPNGPRQGVHPLSHQQQALLALRIDDGPHRTCPTTFAVRVNNVDARRLARAIACLGQRHPALRTAIGEHGGRWHQWVAADSVPLAVLDTRALAVLSPLAGARSWARTQRIDLDGRTCLTRWALIPGTDYDVLVLAAHPMALDSWSWGLLLHELAGAYRDPRTLGPVPPAYSDYTRWQHSTPNPGHHLHLNEATDHLGAQNALRLPGAAAYPPAIGTTRTVTFAVPPAAAEQIRNLARQTSVTMFHLVVALCSASIAQWAQANDFVVASTAINREPGTEAIVGLFTTRRLTHVRVGHGTTPMKLAEQIRDRWLDTGAWPRTRIDTDLAAQSRTAIEINYNDVATLRAPLPAIGAVPATAVEIGETRTSATHLAVSLTPDRTGGLAVSLTYRIDILTRSGARAVAAAVQQSLLKVSALGTEGAGRG
ncbi:condensation domain-containing protein [Nocardia brasiliensis]|uniref:condensation domain-containing protein n=1 Tax=Nocardia brasiliensis TaxID=37326 RepID=UPI00245394DF|nr:condensation domain-containing protein [Nocardia brasiliensis]